MDKPRKITAAQAARMSRDEQRRYMEHVWAALKAGAISRGEADTLRKPIRRAIVATF